MKIQEITSYLESIAPLSLQEDYDNSGLIAGNPGWEVTNVLVCLDSTPEVIAEARKKNCNLVIAHHPIVFGGLKKFNGKSYVERTVIEAIKHDIAIYAIHTNLDNVLHHGVNEKIAQKLGLSDIKILRPKDGLLLKIVCFCPPAQAPAVKDALFAAGAGHIGNYDSCSFNLEGEGTFRGNEHSQPFAGEKGSFHTEKEIRIETIVPQYALSACIEAMLAAHPYEEPAYDIYPLKNKLPLTGSGVTGELPESISTVAFLDLLKERMNIPMVRYTVKTEDKVKKIAICGGSGSFLLPDAIRSQADVFLSSDFKYHQFFDGEGKIMIADIGHYEGEYFTIELISELLTKKYRTFAVIFSETNTNPIKYHC